MPDTLEIGVSINGRLRRLTVEPRVTLAELLRDRLGLTGLKVSCDVQVCGACTVLVDGLAISACTYLAVDADGRAVTTVEGLAPDRELSPLQQAFIDQAAFQCGYCTPGMLVAGTALLAENPRPTHEQVVAAIDGNICRCTGYVPIIDAILQASAANGHGPTAEAAAPAAGPAEAGR